MSATSATPRQDPAPRPPQPDDLLTLEDVIARTKLGRSTIYRYVEAESFPAPLKLSGRVVRWIKREIDEWQDAIAQRRT